MIRILKLQPHRHTGRHQPHPHTSYAGLAFILLLVGVLLAGITFPARASGPDHPDQKTPEVFENPTGASVGVSALVSGPAPTRGAQIFSPRTGSRFSTSPVTVSGSCPRDLIVSIFKNNVFAGSAVCSREGAFSLPVDLFDGENILIARVEDALGQRGPDSGPVTVTYASPTFQSGPGGGFGKQLFVQAPYATKGATVGEKVTWRFSILGGTAPYAVSWDWGDGKTDLEIARAEGMISRTHTYDRPGNYRVVIRVTDAAGNSAIIQVVTIVVGESTAAIGASSKSAGLGILLAWPIYLFAAMLVFCFWLGERREIGVLRKKGRLLES